MTDSAARPPASVAARLATAPMSRLQWIAVALAVLLNALDGFDVLAITFAAPGIAADWGTRPAALGFVLSSGFAGMAAGSLFIAPFGDRYGRRPLILICLALMSIGMALTATAGGIVMLSVWRVLTGLGIGGLVATLNAVAAEFANDRRRDFSVALVTLGYPAGGLVGGLIVAAYIDGLGWRAIFLFGALLSAATIPIIWLALPESLQLLSRWRTPKALATLNRLLVRMGHTALSRDDIADQSAPPPQARGGFAELLAPDMRRLTLLLVTAYFLHLMTFYFYSGWLPKLISDMGYSTPDAIRTSAIMSLGGIMGGSLLGWVAPRFGLRRLVVASMVGTTLTMGAFGYLHDLQQMQVLAFFVGICMFGGIVGLYASIARAFPTRLRVTGTGLAIGLGRGGAMIGPVVGGWLLQEGLRAGTVMSAIAVFALAAAAALALAPDHTAVDDD